MVKANETLKLNVPINVNGQQVSEIHVRRPKVKDQIIATKHGEDPMDQELALFASLTGVAPSDLEEMDLGDYKALQEIYSGFLSSRKKK